MSSSTQSTTQDQAPATDANRCSWSDADDAVMLRVLKEQKDLGNQSGAGWKKTVWQLVETALQAVPVPAGARTGAPKTASKISDHWNNVSAMFLLSVRIFIAFLPHFYMSFTRLLHANLYSSLRDCSARFMTFRTRQVLGGMMS